jgi:hypothetical protein
VEEKVEVIVAAFYPQGGMNDRTWHPFGFGMAIDYALGTIFGSEILFSHYSLIPSVEC